MSRLAVDALVILALLAAACAYVTQPVLPSGGMAGRNGAGAAQDSRSGPLRALFPARRQKPEKSRRRRWLHRRHAPRCRRAGERSALDDPRRPSPLPTTDSLPCLRGAVACGLTYRAPGPTHALLGRDCFAASAATRLP